MNRRAKLIIRLAGAAIFMALLAGTSFVLLEKYFSQPSQTVIIKELDHPSGFIGGVVVNEQGLPIPNVILTIDWLTNPNGRGRRQRGQVRTDDRGRWTFGETPRASLGGLRLFLEQPDYTSASPPVPPADQLLSEKAVLVMRSGIDISGQVVDESGRPIAHAHLTTRQRYWVNEGLTAESDTAGRFALRHVGTNPAPILTTQAPGFAPDVQRVEADGGVAVVRIVLSHGLTLPGTVTDQIGHPLAAVALSVNSWRGFRSVNIRAVSDKLGHFELRDLPADGFWLWAHKKNYIAAQPWIFPQARQINLALWYPINVHGKVIDALTRQPIAHFMVLSGRKNPSKPDFTFNTPAVAFGNGQYQLTLKAPPDGSDFWYIRIVAGGYQTATSAPVRDSGAVDFTMLKNSG